MRVTVRLFARLRDVAGASDLECDVPEGATAATLWAQLASEHPDLDRYRESVSTAVNAEYSRMSQPLADGDEVAFLPPVSGGSEGTRGSGLNGPGAQKPGLTACSRN